MNSILPMKEENISGLALVEFIPASHVDTIERPFNEKITSAITLLSGKAWFSLAYTQETSPFICNEEKSSAGSMFHASVSGFTPKMQQATAAVFNEMREELFIVKVTDHNGNIRIAGTKKEPLKFSYSESTQAEFGRRQGYAWAFTRDLRDAPPYYDI